MAVIKLSKDQIKKKDDTDKIKLNKNQISVDTARFSGKEYMAKKATNALKWAELTKSPYIYEQPNNYLKAQANALGLGENTSENGSPKLTNPMTPEQKALLDYDQEAGSTTIKELETTYNDAKKIQDAINERVELVLYGQSRAGNLRATRENVMATDPVVAELQKQLDPYGDVDALWKDIQEKKRYHTLAGRAQKAKELSSVVENEDFLDNSKYVSTEIKHETFWDRFRTGEYGLGYDDLTHQYINGDEEFRAEVRNKHTTYTRESIFNDGESWYEEANLDQMNDTEIQIYNYYYNTEGKEKAEEYLDSIQETLNYRKAQDTFAGLEDKVFLELMFGVEAGVDQFMTGSKNLFSNADYIPTSDTQFASGMVREDLADSGAKLPDWLGGSSIGQVGYDMVTTTANMLPSILASAVSNVVVPGSGAITGSVLLGASASGNAYAEMVNLGYTKGQARTYSTLVGASEGVLQYALGGISKLGGKVSGNAVSKLVSKIDNAFARTAIKLGGNMASEGLEEAIQTALEPAFKALATGEDFESAEWDEILYSALLGAVSGGIFEGADIGASHTATAINDTKVGKNIINEATKAENFDTVSAMKSLAYEMAGDQKTYDAKQLAKTAGKIDYMNLNARQVGKTARLLNESVTSQNKADIKTALVEKGFSEKDATRISEALYKKSIGESLTKKEELEIENSEQINEVLRDVVGNADSSINARTGKFVAAMNGVNPSVATQDSAQQAEAADVTKDASAKQIATESEFKASESGSTMYNGEDVSIKKVVSTEGGLKVELDNGETVNAKDVSFSSDGEAMMYEMVARMETSPETAQAILEIAKPSDAASARRMFSEITTAYRYGKINFEAGLKNLYLSKAMKTEVFNLGREDAIRSTKTENNVASEQPKKTNAKAKKSDAKKTSKIIFEDGVKVGDIATEMQKASMKGVELLSKLVKSLELHVFASWEENGERYAIIDGEKRKAPNGYFKKGTNKIYIDINAGSRGEGYMLYTLGHEVTHFIKAWNAAGFKKLGDFLIKNFGEKNVPLDRLIAKKKAILIESYKRDGKALPSDNQLYMEAYEEVVADSMVSMFTDPSAYEKLAELKQENKQGWEKLKEAIKSVLDKLKSLLNVYKDEPASTEEARYVKKFSKDVYDKLQDLYLNAFVEADANYQAAKRDGTENKHLNNRHISYNERAVESHKAKLEEQYSNDASIDLDTLMKRYDKIISIWKSLGGELDSKFLNEWNNKVGKDRAFTVFKAQSGYKYNVELSSMCKKGVPLFEAIDTIVKKEVMKELGTDVLGKAEKEILYDILKAHSFEIPCAICYVEQARQREGAIIDSFLNGKIEKDSKGKTKTFKLGWNEVLKDVEKEMKALGVDYTFQAVDRAIATDKYAPADTSMDATTQEAFYNALKKIANKEITRYNKEEGKSRKLVNAVTPAAIKEAFKGTLPSNLKIFKVLFTDPSARFTLESDLLYSSMTTHNLAMSHNALYSLFNSQGGVSGYKTKQGTVVYWGDILGKTWKPSAVRDEGGIRNQSNSDFQMYTLLDQAQMYIDFSAKGYYLQAYTKVLAELKLFGLSRGKINASLIPAVYEYRNADGSVDVKTTRENAGLDKNRDLLFDDFEGINHKEAFMLLEDAEYSKSIGGICIGYSDNHILKLLGDQRVQQIIGFHDKTDDPDKRYRGARYAKNYNGLNEAINKDGKTVHIGFNPYIRKAEKMFTFDAKTETYSGEIEYNGKTYVADDIPKLAADLYLEMCEKKGYTPAYTDFGFHENYYKLLADFSLYDSQGHYAPHRKVAYNMPDKVPYLDINGKKQYMPTKDYIKAELEKELSVRDAISEALADESENGIIPQFKKRVNEAHKVQEQMNSYQERQAKALQKKDPTTLKENDLINLLQCAKRKVFPDGSFIPVRINTPKILIDFASEMGYTLENLPMAMRVYKARQAISSVEEWDGRPKDKAHNLAPEEVVEIIRAMDNPSYLVLETENERFVEIVKFDRGKEKAYAVIDFADGNKNPDQMNGYKGGKYNIFLTVYPSEDAQELKDYLKNKNNTVITGEEMKKKGASQRGLGSFVPARLNDSPFFEPIVSQDSDSVKREFSEGNSYSERDNVGYHAGDLGKAEYYHQQGYGRGTGHFGTGTYFVGEEAKISGSTYGNRPHHAVDFSDYKLYKIKSDKDGYDLHEQLKVIDGGFSAEWLNAAFNDEFRLFSITDGYDIAREKFGENIYTNEALLYGFGELAKRRDIKVMSKEEYAKSEGVDTSYEWLDDDYLEYLKNTIEKEAEKVNDRYGEFRESYFYLWLRFGSNNTKRALQETLRYQQEINPEGERNYFAEKEKKADSLATVFMKSLGYEGIDVRGTRLDNTEYGSVIYDLKEATILYQERDPDSISNRSLLANALESAAKEGEERNILRNYKTNLRLLEAEQAKLADVRQKAYDLRFKKGRTAEETKALNNLDFEAKLIAKRINTYDRELLKIEAMKPIKDVLNREKQMAYKRAEQRGKEALKKQREMASKNYKRLLKEKQEERKNAIERRKMSEVRGKIKRLKQKMESSLLNSTDNNYIPVGLVGAMVDVCTLIDTDTPLYKKDGSLNMAQAKRDATKERLLALKDEYEKLKTDADPLLKVEYEEEVYEYLKELYHKFSGKRLADMSLDELNELYETLRAVQETIQDAKKVIGWGDASDVYAAGDKIAAEQKSIVDKRKKDKRTAAQKVNDGVINVSLSPVRNVERMSGYRSDSPMLKLFNDFERGVRKKNMFSMEAHKDFEEVSTGKNAKAYEDAIYEGFGDELTDDSGHKFKVSKMQMMQAIMSYEREVANPHMHHLEGSGFTFADLDLLRKGKLGEAISAEHSHRVTLGMAMAQKFADALKDDQWAQDYMAAARKFFDEKAKNAINDTYITLKHRIIARDKNYIPFEVDKSFVVQEISAEEGIQQTISSYGMLKDKKDGASQPLIITGLNNILERHIDQVGNVYGLAIPVRNFNKVWNVRTIDSGFGGDPTIKGIIETVWGKKGKEFVEQTVKDIQGRRPNTQSALYRKIKSNYISATFLLNGSVVLKQVGSLFASTSMLKWRDPVSMLANLAYTMAHYKSISAEVDKYTATVWVRRQGVSDSELQTLATEAKNGGIAKLLSKAPAWISPQKWIAAMDSSVALSLWKYAKEDTAKRTGLQGEELMKATAEFFDSVVENTQSMADVLHRPEIQKRSDIISEALGMFKTDLYQMAGQLQVSLGRYQNNKSKENGAALGRTAYSIMASAVWASLMTSLFAALRYKVNQYRDDEDDEITLWSWLEEQLSSLLTDIAGYIFPLAGSEIAGFIDTIVTGKGSDIVDNLVLTAINDTYNSIIKAAQSIKEGEMPSADMFKDVIANSLQMFGVPSKNVARILEAIALHLKDIENGEFLSFEAERH